MNAKASSFLLISSLCGSIAAFSPTAIGNRPLGDLLRLTEKRSDTEELPLLMKDMNSTAPAQFGDVVQIRRPSVVPEAVEVDQQPPFPRSRNIAVAVASIALASLNYLWQFLHPTQPLQLLVEMQRQSDPLSIVGHNGQPTVVDFWAPWCENCQLMAPTLSKVEERYRDRVNFVLVNGDLAESWPAIERMGVDAIPHMALVDERGSVQTALIGIIPKHVLEEDLDVLIENAGHQSERKRLPYTMLDAFPAATSDEERIVDFRR